MDTYRVKPIKNKKNIVVSVPGSKSITNRALMLAAMSNGVCTLNGVLFSADSRAFLDCLVNLGFEISIDEKKCQVAIKGENGNIPNKKATVNVQSAGTAARFITVLLAVAGGDYVLESSNQMKKRPMQELLDALENKGIQIKYLENKGHFPFEIHSEGLSNVEMTIDTTTSSQYASALLMASVVTGMKINLTGSRVGGAYIKITLKMMEQFGIHYEVNKNTYKISNQTYKCHTYNIEPDMSAACYFYAMALILRTKSMVYGIHKDSMQGDKKFLEVLKDLGCIVSDSEDGVIVDASFIENYDGIDLDMSDFSDQALTMAVVAAFAQNKTIIRNIGHIRGQESDRVQVIADELKKLGAKTHIIESNGRTAVEIYPIDLNGRNMEDIVIDTYDDHRVAMSFAMAGLLIDNVVIKNPMCCKKTFENYFDVLDEITK